MYNCIDLWSIFIYRYNISSGEYNGFDSFINSDIGTEQAKIFNPQTNTVTLNKKISTLDVYSKFGFDYNSAKEVSNNATITYVQSV